MLLRFSLQSSKSRFLFDVMLSNAYVMCLICLDVVNSEVELPRSSSTPEKEDERPDTEEQQERDSVIPLEDHSLTEGNI